MPGRPLILGHRGAPQQARENSLASFTAALDSGADGIELDVHCTSDGVLVAHHDDELPTGEKIAQTAYEELKSRTELHGYELPQLSDVFELVAGKGLLNIELKHDGYEEAVLKLAREMLPAESYAVSSFSATAVCMCHKAAPDVPAFLIVWGERNGHADLERLQALGAAGIAFEDGYLTPELVGLFREHNYPIFLWTVNDAAKAQRYATWGVTGLITDTPRELVAALDHRQP